MQQICGRPELGRSRCAPDGFIGNVTSFVRGVVTKHVLAGGCSELAAARVGHRWQQQAGLVCLQDLTVLPNDLTLLPACEQPQVAISALRWNLLQPFMASFPSACFALSYTG